LMADGDGVVVDHRTVRRNAAARVAGIIDAEVGVLACERARHVVDIAAAMVAIDHARRAKVSEISGRLSTAFKSVFGSREP